MHQTPEPGKKRSGSKLKKRQMRLPALGRSKHMDTNEDNLPDLLNQVSYSFDISASKNVNVI